MPIGRSIFVLSAVTLLVAMISGCGGGFESGHEQVAGQKAMSQGKYQEAIDHFKKAIALGPSGPNYTFLGMAYEKAGAYTEAAANFNKAIDTFGTTSENVLKIQHLANEPTIGTAYGHAASVFLKLKNVELARSYIKKAIELGPANAQNFSVRSAVEHALNDNEQAVDDANKAINMDPHNAEAYRVLALCKLEAGKYRDSISDCNAAIAIAGSDVEAEKIKSQAEKLAASSTTHAVHKSGSF